ncbi:MAG: efflux RND transporter periplasmic adaptor subunit [Chloroflexi bacterium]|nr:efflux RND transporter periplasmic adaptor subunit [Chloroflexota bacterium]MBL6960249.1 efflux RND transporter periplasmic adaptor subunit [Anaerolineales bacterium]
MKKITLLTLALLALALAACGTAPAAPQATLIPTVIADKTIVAEGKIEPIHFAEIAFNANGVVSEVLVHEGQIVKKGDVLARLGNSESYQAEVARAEEALILAQRVFDTSESTVLKDLGVAYETVRQTQIKFDNFDIPSDLAHETPAEGFEKTYAKVEEARTDYEPYKYLSDDNQAKKIRKDWLDNAWSDLNQAIRWAKLEADLNTAKSNLESALKEFNALTDNSQGDSLAKAEYETAQANLSAAKAALASVELVAPFDGIVAGLNVKVGGSVNPGQTAVTIADFSSWLVKTTDLTELDVVKIAQDQAVNVSLDAIPDSVFTGKVISIGQTYADRQGDIVYEVTVTLTSPHPAMRWGMTAVVKFSE